MIECLAVSDLDNTLIWPSREVSLEHQRNRVCVERHRGQELSFVSDAAWVALESLSRVGTLVPATARTPEQLDRVRLPGRPPTYIVCLNGARILVNGRADPHFEAFAAKRLKLVASFVEVCEVLRRHSRGREFIQRVREADHTFFYLIHDATPPPDWLAELTQTMAAMGWSAIVERRRTYIVPSTIGKEHAVAWLQDRLHIPHLVVAGDGLLDRRMLQLGFRSIVPRGSALALTVGGDVRCELSIETGTRAGTEIARWLLARVGGPTQDGMPCLEQR